MGHLWKFSSSLWCCSVRIGQATNFPFCLVSSGYQRRSFLTYFQRHLDMEDKAILITGCGEGILGGF
uniref:Uncharacterized protein n=1 Tax=Ditylenchus dipsaci TaxID=166011 RepID=A0A915DQ22_9BILA